MTLRHSHIRLALALVAICILWAGLYPFRFVADNTARWMVDDSGLHFDGSGQALSATPLTLTAGAGDRFAEIHLEVTLTPGGAASSRQKIFVLLDDLRMPGLILYQEGPDIVIADRVVSGNGHRWYNDIRVPGVVSSASLIAIAIRDRPRGPQIRINGAQVTPDKAHPIALLQPGEQTLGRLLIGSGRDGNSPWTGTLHAFRVEDGASGRSYRLGLRSGPETLENSAADIPIILPDHYRSLREPLANSPAPASDVVLNVIGFIPLGALLLLWLGPSPVALLRVQLMGTGLSLGIEWTQNYAVGRVSAIEDLWLNALGTLIGLGLSVLLVRSGLIRTP